jgi:hypothetical protein
MLDVFAGLNEWDSAEQYMPLSIIKLKVQRAVSMSSNVSHASSFPRVIENSCQQL